MMRRSVMVVLAAMSAAGCSGGGGSGDAQVPADVSSPTDVAGDTASDTAVGTDAASEAGAAALHDCTTFTDRSAAGAERMVHFHSAAYSPRCMTIAAGQMVTFMGDTSIHPLRPGVAPSRAGDPAGTSPNPIPATDSGDITDVTFPTAGLYPYYCATHEGAMRMYGVIRVQ